MVERTINDRLGFATFAANEAHSLPGLLQSVKPYFDEIVCICTQSDDGTWEYLREMEHKWFPLLRPYKLSIPLSPGHFDFGYVRSTAAHLSHCGYVFMLDADERMDNADLEKVQRVHKKALANDLPLAAFRRRHWYDGPKQRQKENIACAPDWQTRMIRNNGMIWFRRPVHEMALYGPDGVWLEHIGCGDIVIHHHHDWFKSKAAVRVGPQYKHQLYQQLAASDPDWSLSFKADLLPADEPRRRTVRKLYKDLLKRDATLEEIRVWVGSDKTENQIREEMLESKEYKQQEGSDVDA